MPSLVAESGIVCTSTFILLQEAQVAVHAALGACGASDLIVNKAIRALESPQRFFCKVAPMQGVTVAVACCSPEFFSNAGETAQGSSECKDGDSNGNGDEGNQVEDLSFGDLNDKDRGGDNKGKVEDGSDEGSQVEDLSSGDLTDKDRGGDNKGKVEDGSLVEDLSDGDLKDTAESKAEIDGSDGSQVKDLSYGDLIDTAEGEVEVYSREGECLAEGFKGKVALGSSEGSCSAVVAAGGPQISSPQISSADRTPDKFTIEKSDAAEKYSKDSGSAVCVFGQQDYWLISRTMCWLAVGPVKKNLVHRNESLTRSRFTGFPRNNELINMYVLLVGGY